MSRLVLDEIAEVVFRKGDGYGFWQEGGDVVFTLRRDGVLKASMGCSLVDVEKHGAPFIESLLSDLKTLSDAAKLGNPWRVVPVA